RPRHTRQDVALTPQVGVQAVFGVHPYLAGEETRRAGAALPLATRIRDGDPLALCRLQQRAAVRDRGSLARPRELDPRGLWFDRGRWLGARRRRASKVLLADPVGSDTGFDQQGA